MWPLTGPHDRGPTAVGGRIWRGPADNASLRTMLTSRLCLTADHSNGVRSVGRAPVSALAVWLFLLLGCRPAAAPESGDRLVAGDLDRYFETYWQSLVPALEALVRANDLATLPAHRSLVVGTSPAYLAGQSVVGVDGAGPFEPTAVTFLFVPVPGGSANRSERASFFADFNRPFTRMIVAHELIPGHYLQGRIAARVGRPVRAIFTDGVYTEGWGMFVERLMLEAGWGGPLEWLAHYKKQLENIARTIVDIRVHTKGLDRASTTC